MQFGNTALHVAAWNGRLDVLELLLEAGADMTLVNKVVSTQ